MALVYGFGGMRDYHLEIDFDPRLPTILVETGDRRRAGDLGWCCRHLALIRRKDETANGRR
jgi:hypothetical protein